MDVLTQGLLGAALAQTIAKKKEGRLATVVGFLAGLVADADIFIFSNSDPLLTLDYHRHFSHSVFFIPIGALIASALLWYFVRNKLSFKRLYLFCLLGYSLSGFIDACTSYGTYLLWPLINERIAFNIISIVDPVFTGVLLISIVLAWKKCQPKMVYWGLGFCAFYLSVASVQLYRAEQVAIDLLSERHHLADKVLIKPSFANIILWKLVYISDDRIYTDAIRVGFSSKVYAGNSVAVFKPEINMPEISPSSILYTDIQRFKKFSAGFIALSPVHKNVLGDMRYSMSPNQNKPIWGIKLDAAKQHEHVSYGFYRENNSELRHRFMDMLKGK